MKELSFMDIYLKQTKVWRKIVDIGEWLIIIATAFLLPYPRIEFPPFNYIIGIIFLTTGVWVHHLAHRIHPQAHFPKEKITKLITDGIYSKIRHPCYTGYILAYIGLFFILSSIWTLLPIFIFSLFFYYSVLTEEKFLMKKFGEKYRDYIKKTRWRFIPYLF